MHAVGRRWRAGHEFHEKARICKLGAVMAHRRAEGFIVHAVPSAVRRGIFVERQAKIISSPIRGGIFCPPGDVAPDGA